MIDKTKKAAFKVGLILGLIIILISLFIHLTNLNLITNTWLGVVIIVLNILFGIISVVSAKKILNGFITFKEGFTSYFVTIFTSFILSTIFIIIYYNFFISPQDIEYIKEIMINFNLDIMKNNNSTLAEIENAKILSKDYDPSNAGYIIKSSLFYLLRDCLIGLLVALVFRNKSSN